MFQNRRGPSASCMQGNGVGETRLRAVGLRDLAHAAQTEHCIMRQDKGSKFLGRGFLRKEKVYEYAVGIDYSVCTYKDKHPVYARNGQVQDTTDVDRQCMELKRIKDVIAALRKY